jgi:hypothetical protein
MIFDDLAGNWNNFGVLALCRIIRRIGARTTRHARKAVL